MPENRTRTERAVIIEALLEYLVSILTTGSFLAALLKSLGASDSLTGILSAATSLACVTRLFSGVFASRIHRPRRSYILFMLIDQGLFCFLYFIPFFELSSAAKAAVFAGLYLIAVLFQCLMMPSKYQWLMGFISRDVRGRFCARKEIVSLIGGMVFSILMGYICDTFRDSGRERIGFLFCAVAILLIAVFYTLTLGRGTPDTETEEKKGAGIFAAFSLLRTSRAIRCQIVSDLLHNAAYYASIPFFGTYLIGELGYSLTAVSLFGVLYAVVRAGFSPIMGRYTDKKGNYASSCLCTAILCLANFIMMFTSPSARWLYGVYYGLWAIAYAGYNVAYTNLTYDYVSDTDFASFFGLRSAICGAAGFGISLLGSLLVSFMQSHGNMLFGHTVYAQQLLSLSAALFYGIKILYDKTILKNARKELP